jgi:hypothetical protein
MNSSSFEELKVVPVVEYAVTYARDSEHHHMVMAYLSARAMNGDEIHLQINSSRTATELAAQLIDLANVMDE